MKARTKNLSNQYTSADAGVKSITVHSPEANKMFIGGVAVNLQAQTEADTINNFALVIENTQGDSYALLNRATIDDFSSAELRDQHSADGSRYYIGDIVMSSEDTLKVVSDVAPSSEINIDVRLSGFEDTDR